MSAVLTPTSTPAPQAPLRHPQLLLWAVCALSMMSTAGVALPYPILAPIFVGGPVDSFTHFAGLPPELLMGLALAVNPAGILIGSLFVGPMSDRYGRRRVLSITLTATLISYGLSAVALAQRNYPLFVLSRFVTGLTEGNVAVVRALLADWHPQLDRTRSFAWLNASLYIGWLVGPLLGGLTLPLGEAVPFVVSAAILVPCLVLLLMGLPDDKPMRHAEETDLAHPVPLFVAMRRQQSLGLLVTDPVLRHLAALQMAYTLGVNALYEFAPLWMLQQAGLDSRGIALVTAVQCGAMTAASMLAARIGSGPTPLRRAARFAVVAAFGLLALSFAPSWAGLALIPLLGVPLSFYNALMPAWMSERFAAYGQGRVMGLLTTVFCLSNTLIALIGGGLGMLSARWIMLLGGCMCLMAAIGFIRFARQHS
ncbi:Predicted arabinose efflux permease, MFS family [Roseateles sp. YR242]|uniref:MFS transporter n=1 Tax=Roseateles sp. YR242 TaxID=1855305 RepID=UPI0008B7BA01|nr:MFS transporter [Roseateles sp. YR242]SEK36951.1 Predicted arabinose efflux permease, MFS family [Roseateles sp. YR242]